MGEIRFKKLASLLRDMEKKEYLLDSFPFTYNGIKTIVILKKYKNGEKKPRKYAYAKLEFIEKNNKDNSIKACCDFYEVYFENFVLFCDFFNISEGEGNKALFVAFADCFANYIPEQKVIKKTDLIERRLLGGRMEGNNPNAVYLFDVRRSGRKENGERKKRTLDNSNKTETLKEDIYLIYKDDIYLSFYYSDSEQEGLSDEEIISKFANRSL